MGRGAAASGPGGRLLSGPLGAPVRFLADWTAHFLGIQGVDRAAALGGQAFTALFPLLIVYATIVPGRDSADFADTLIERFELSGASAASVEQAFAPAGTVESSVTFLSVFLLIVSALSFTRALQRLFEQAHGLPKLGMRGTPYGLLWLLFVGVYLTLRPLVVGSGAGIDTPVLSLALASLLWLGTPYLLLGRRVGWHALVPTAVLTGTAMTLYGGAGLIWLPRTVESSADQFGIIGVAFALLTWLVGAGFVLVLAATGGALAYARLRPGRSGVVPAGTLITR